MLDKYNNFLKTGEKIIKIFVFTLFCLVVITQFLITYQPISAKISLLDTLEGEKISNNIEHPTSDFNLAVNNVTFKVISPYLSSLPQGKVLINGEKVTDFTNLQTTVNVNFNDKITLDFTYYLLDLDIKVITSKKIKIPNEIIHIKKGKSVTLIAKKVEQLQ